MECKSYDIEELTLKINEGIELIEGWDRFVKPNMKVLLKVNLIGPKSSDSAAVTHSEFVRALTRILKEKGCIVWIGDSSGGAIGGVAPTKQSFVVSGLQKVSEEEQVEIKNFDKEGAVKCNIGGNYTDEMYLAKPLFDADLVINLPKFKTHSMGIYTGAVKNMFGAIPGLKKAYYHKEGPNPMVFGEFLVDIHKSLSNLSLHIMDGVVAMQGAGPTAGTPYKSNKILISEDPLALDTVVIKMLGMDIKEINILSAAVRRNLGVSKIENIEIYGDYKSAPKLNNFKVPKNRFKDKEKSYSFMPKLINFLRAQPVVDSKKCVHCNTCLESCPVDAISNSKEMDYDKCIECLCCHELCMYKAVELKKVNKLADIFTKLYRGKYSK